MKKIILFFMFVVGSYSYSQTTNTVDYSYGEKVEKTSKENTCCVSCKRLNYYKELDLAFELKGRGAISLSEYDEIKKAIVNFLKEENE